MVRVLTLITALLVTLITSSAQAERRVALVIGNGAYAQAAPLANPANDARAVAAALTRLGFEVISGFDLSNADLRRTVRAFVDKLVGADVAMFFYAGHGLQVAGENYLIPVDAAIRIEADLDFNAVRMDLISRQLDREARVKIIMLDACRDNPFEKELARSMGRTRSALVKRGLAEINSAGGTLIAFATDPGSVALDGSGRHSPFTTALLRHIETPGVEIGLVMRRVTRDVFESTGERQRPWINASLTGELYLKPRETAGAAPPAPPTATPTPPGASGFDDRQLELAMWQAAEKSGQAGDYKEYLKRYPNGQFAGLARNRLDALRNKPAAGGQGPPAETPVAPKRTTASRPDAGVSSRWVDNWGAVYSMTLAGDRYRFTASGQACRGPYTSQGTGVVTGQRVEVSYRSTYSVGSCTGTISADGNRITSDCMDSECGPFRTTIERR